MIQNDFEFEKIFKRNKYRFKLFLAVIFIVSLLFISLGIFGAIKFEKLFLIAIGIIGALLTNAAGIFILSTKPGKEKELITYAFNKYNTLDFTLSDERIDTSAIGKFHLSLYGNLPKYRDLITGSKNGFSFYSYTVSYSPGQKSPNHEALFIEVCGNVKEIDFGDTSNELIKDTAPAVLSEDGKLYILFDIVPLRHNFRFCLDPVFYKTSDEYFKRIRLFNDLIVEITNKNSI